MVLSLGDGGNGGEREGSCACDLGDYGNCGEREGGSTCGARSRRWWEWRGSGGQGGRFILNLKTIYIHELDLPHGWMGPTVKR